YSLAGAASDGNIVTSDRAYKRFKMETLLNCAINYDFQPAGIDIFQFLSSLLYKTTKFLTLRAGGSVL
ncbi:MAG TPA: hypothetical protein PKN89_02560, partial [Anaerolineaceae bacterium]|nr:hypothetical protein [Anaerolineaceae bacterium]